MPLTYLPTGPTLSLSFFPVASYTDRVLEVWIFSFLIFWGFVCRYGGEFSSVPDWFLCVRRNGRSFPSVNEGLGFLVTKFIEAEHFQFQLDWIFFKKTPFISFY